MLILDIGHLYSHSYIFSPLNSLNVLNVNVNNKFIEREGTKVSNALRVLIMPTVIVSHWCTVHIFDIVCVGFCRW